MLSVIQSETTNRSSPCRVLRRRVLLGVVLRCGIFSVQHRTDYCVSSFGILMSRFQMLVVLASEFFRMSYVRTPDKRKSGLC